MQRTPFDIPDQMRDMADKSVDQAKQAIQQFLEATQQAVAKAEGSARSVQEGAADLNRQALAFIEENIGASFDLVHRLVQARTVEEVAALQQEFLRKQIQAAAEQGKSIGEMMGKATSQAMDRGKKK